ncbi:bifunctional methylenetetrahydrofolate dehydrogenase/methenyltetrahydrofolate cyclohydrolase FolD [Sphingomicrobium astaxanthinifaciens]|uniref:bifunctional methylenetetrahydrofolate dehydrogenase/methenyltetrahydrofolate cyclohydrolase FolD n=1 Tax=Sphingomicrobium astaxanthinifaciens TaxID=1227949 RepID=UPI001FCAA6A9|nr:bifunctional methylenetetrahydrofolate dehydrogenase/methenyltetrahydrofolate cyclohydrolase FolD [Sphingomicrobium astaxanthinifaciens]MCJ7421304.1 bifunctional methylenetetrahydrofolate dehydrogenase/methenyltetrahydrofolate cyclohydrolase FolD [Sphingomicrobium astaxanthinifaciens]
MNAARAIDGKAAAAALREKVAAGAREFARKALRKPGLHVVLVGEDPASAVYVGAKEKALHKAGMDGAVHRLPASTGEDELLRLVRKLNADPTVDGILVQLPLPDHLDEAKVLDTIDPEKDVDGFHVVNAGKLAVGKEALVPCTPAGCIRLIKEERGDLSGLHAVVIGRSNIVGKPMAQLLLAENATVTIAHSRTRNLPELAKTADILVAAVGRPEMVKGDWVKDGATVIDVGINRLAPAEDGAKGRLVGDVAYDEAARHAAAITPVPGGVGPMTIAMLLANTLVAAHAREGLEAPTL